MKIERKEGIAVVKGTPADIVFGDAIPLAHLTLSPEGLNLLWAPTLFSSGAIDKGLRSELVTLLRFHAKKLESGEMDTIMKKVAKDISK